ncbi:MAG TPA: hypothetical protein VEB21_03850 [Terriglobales bacterium]|nr:hypothetical protein [Terriglobales bacterium]
MPEVLWVAGPVRPLSPARQPALTGTSTADALAVCLVSSADDGGLELHFDLGETIDGILLESYHDGLQPTLEMQLPFNYSRLPNTLKAIARSIRLRGQAATAIAFPPQPPVFVVEWLRDLGAAAGEGLGQRSLARQWPHGHRAAVTLTHDVDTDWLFRHPEWIDRFCDMEEQLGLAGAWYCVPAYCAGTMAEKGIEKLIGRGAEIGCHGYNHDARWPMLSGSAFAARLEAVRRFVERWAIRGFRSEWLWRSPSFLTELAPLFAYDTSVPSLATRFTTTTRNGCGTCFPYRTYGDLIELPLTVPSDEDRHLEGLAVEPFWQRQTERAKQVIEHGGLVVFSIHPQPHQAANRATLAAIEAALRQVIKVEKVWLARPDSVIDWLTGSVPSSRL